MLESMTTRVLLLTVTAVAAGLQVQGQEPSVFGDSVDVDLVLVDVLVSDGDGNPLRDLTIDDFQLYEDGREVELSHFSPAPAAVSAAAGNSDVADTPGHRLVVFIDQIHISPGSRKRVFSKLGDVLKKGLRPRDEVMVVAYEGTSKVLLPFSTDRAKLREVLSAQQRFTARSLVAGLGEERILRLIESRNADENDGEQGDPCVDLGYIARTHAEQVHARVLQGVSELTEFVDSLAPYSGRKSLLHVSDGIPLVAGLAAYRFAIELCDGSGAAKGLANARNVISDGSVLTRWDPTKAWSELTQFDTTAQWTAMAAHANTYQVSFYALQARGNSTGRGARADGARLSLDVEMDAMRNEQDPLFLLADETGGRAILGTNDFGSVVTGMLEDSRATYQLAYSAPTPGDGKQHKIRVEVALPGAEVKHRKSYSGKTSHQRLADSVLATLFHGRRDNPMQASFAVQKEMLVDKRRVDVTLRLWFPLDRLTLLPEGELNKGVFTVFVAARDEHGRRTPVGRKIIPVEVASEELHEGFTYEVVLPLRPGKHDVAIAVQDEVGHQTSFLSKAIEVGADG